MGSWLELWASRWKCPRVTALFRVDSVTNQFKAGEYVVEIITYIHFFCPEIEAGFYSDLVKCLPLYPAAQVQFPPQAVVIFLKPVTSYKE